MKKLIYLSILFLITVFITHAAFSQAIKTKKELNATTVIQPVSIDEIKSGIDVNSNHPVPPEKKYNNPVPQNPIPIVGVKTVGPAPSDYPSITAALADIIVQGLGGAVYLELLPTYTSIVEVFPIGFGTALPTTAANTITIRPQLGAIGLSITSTAAETIIINGGKYIIFDGRPGGLGVTSQLTIDNTSLTGYAIYFISDGLYNTIEYCTVSGNNQSGSGGVIVFSTTTSPNGNSFNTIDHCTIRDNPLGTPANLIYSSGTPGTPNANNTVSNSNLFNWFLPAAVSTTAAIVIYTGNTAWTIVGNSFYQTAPRTFFTASNFTAGAIYLNNTIGGAAVGVNYNISNNFIGGSAPLCSGPPMIWSAPAGVPVYRMIYFKSAIGAPSIIMGNTISNISLTSAAAAATPPAHALILHSDGNVNIMNNTLGSQTLPGDINFTQAAAANYSQLYGIFAGGSITTCNVTVGQNTIGGINVSSTGAGYTEFRIFYTQQSVGSSVIFNNNFIGGTIPNSIIQNTSGSIYGLMSLAISLNQQITNNTIRNISVNSAATIPSLNGMYLQGLAVGGSFNATGNLIHTLTSNTPNVNINNAASVVGFILTAATNAGSVISGNTIYDLINTNATVAGCVSGMYFATPPALTGQTVITKNLIHSFSTVNNQGYQIGIFFPNTGVGMISNNMIRLGIDATGASVTTSPFILGIWKASSADVGVYFNSVYIGGTCGTANSDTYGYLRSTASAGDSVMNNILLNARTNLAGAALNYGIVVDTIPPGIVCNYNDIFANGIGGMFGAIGTLPIVNFANLAAWQVGTLLDMNSVSGNPQFLNPTGNSLTVDLHINTAVFSIVDNTGTPLAAAAALVDIDNDVRSITTPDIGADEFIGAPLSLGLTAMLSGNYNGTTHVSKNVTVELHNSTTPYALVEAKVVKLDASGLANPMFTIAMNGIPYYIVIRSNNGLETWSATPQTFVGGVLSYDFTFAQAQAFGSNQLLIGTKWCIISGDANQDGSVDALDRSLCWNDRNLTGVYATDLNGDGVVDALDRSIAWNNRNHSVQKPALLARPVKGAKQDSMDNKNSTKGTYDLKLDGSNSKKVVKNTNN